MCVLRQAEGLRYLLMGFARCLWSLHHCHWLKNYLTPLMKVAGTCRNRFITVSPNSDEMSLSSANLRRSWRWERKERGVHATRNKNLFKLLCIRRSSSKALDLIDIDFLLAQLGYIRDSCFSPFLQRCLRRASPGMTANIRSSVIVYTLFNNSEDFHIALHFF